MARFTLPRDLYHGKGALEALKSFTGKKAMICVGGGSMKRFGFLDRAVAYLKEAGMEVELFEGIEPDPSVETVMRGAEAMLKFEPDWIIAMGGGSPIDAAKAMWIKYEYPDITFEEMCKVFGIPPLRRKNDALNIPHCIQHYGPDSYPAEQGFVPENVFLERLPEIAKNAIADACTGSNPRQPSQEEMEKLLKCCYYDTDVDF